MIKVLLFSKDELKVDLACSDALTATDVVVSHEDIERFRITLSAEQQFIVPAAILDAGKTRLLAPKEFQDNLDKLSKDIAQTAEVLAREALIAKLQEIEKARAVLAEALASRRIMYDGAAQANIGFFGLTKSAAGAFRIDLTISLATLIEDDGKPDTEAIVFEALAVIVGQLNGHAFGFELAVRITRDGLAKLIPTLDIPALAFPDLPKLDLAWPALPNFPLDLTSITLPGLDRLLRLDLPKLPKLELPYGDFPVAIKWTTEPVFKLSITGGELAVVTTTPGAGKLVIKRAKTELADITGFGFALTGGNPSLAGTITTIDPSLQPIYDDKFTIDSKYLPFVLRHEKANATVRLQFDGTCDLAYFTAKLAVTIIIALPRLEIEARDDPSVFLTLSVEYRSEYDGASYTGHLSKLEIVAPYPIALITHSAKTALAGVVRMFASIDTTTADIEPLLARLAEFAAVFARWVARAESAAGAALLDIGEAMVAVLGRVFALLKKGSQYIAIEVRLDAASYKLLQIWISPLYNAAAAKEYSAEALGFHIAIAKTWRPALVIDVSEPRTVTALVLKPAKTSDRDLVVSTDLWYEREGGPTEAVRDTSGTTSANKPLIEIVASTPAADAPIIGLIVCDGGRFTFFRKLLERDIEEEYGGNKEKLTLISGRPRFADLTIGADDKSDIAVKVKIAEDAKSRLLPFLFGPPAEDSNPDKSSPLDGLGQYIKIKDTQKEASVEDGKATIPISVEIALAEFKTEADINIKLDLRTFKASLEGPGALSIRGTERTETLLGLDARIKAHPPVADPNVEFEQFVLDFRGGGVRFSLSPHARLDLWYRRIASEGRGLVFKVSDFAVGRGGIDLEATADPDVPVTLAGIEVPFRFTEGGVSIKNGKLNSFAVTGKGQLPPRLIGEANLTASIAFGRQDGRLTFQSADVKLDKSADPIVSKTTRFTFTLQKIELFGRDFDVDGIHFWFALTGSARSTGLPGGLLKNFTDLEITGDKFPLTTNARVLKRYLTDFNVAVRMKRAINFFNIFKFELRSFGFYPSVDRFGGEPAIAVSGQMNFALSGDVVSPKIDFHRMWIAPPKSGSALPQVAFDGLGVELKIGGAQLEATAITVDGDLPSLAKDPGIVYEQPITAEGFLASGRLKIDGWAPMAAAMGFLEIHRLDGEVKHSFFAFGQAEELSIEIPTPIGMFYLREVGFGFGFRYTFAGLVAADQVKSPAQLIKVLDDVAKRQGELATFSAWAPETEGDRLTLAMRALFTVASASGKNALSEAERNLSNVLMFDVAAAIRSDLTFLMTARGWINTNYYTFVHGELKDGSKDVMLAREAIRTNPPLTGYIYISVPRQTFFGRLVADGKGYIGKTPEIHPNVRKMLSGVSWSATLFIQPGLFHFEMGWPYELKLTFAEESAVHKIKIDLSGGFIFRIEGAAMLYGIAFRGAGFAQLGGSVGSSSFGASAVARADFDIAGKFIAYIPALEPKNTLFYGAIAFSNTLSLGIAVWLRIKIFGGTISFYLSLSISRTITVALELAVSPQELGGRGSASVAFSAFGRTLRIGVSLGLNTGALERARVKVERFLAIGLDNATPDPEKSLAPPPPPTPPAKAAEDVEKSVADEHAKQEEIDKIEAEPIGAPSFWAILFEIPAEQTEGSQHYVMTLVPRDDTEVADLQPPEGTFFAPPPVKADCPVTDYWLDPVPSVPTFLHVTSVGIYPVTTGYRITANYQATIESTAEGALLLWHFAHECFLATKVVDGEVVKAPDDKILEADLKQPKRTKIIGTRVRLPENKTLATEMLRAAALDQLPELDDSEGLAIADYQREVEERRSAVIAAIGESAAKLALAATYDTQRAQKWSFPPRAATGIDARDFGLTFVVDAAAVNGLFEGANADTPRPSNFVMRTRTEKDPHGPAPADKSPVHLLNPPERFFRTAKPAFAAQTASPTRDGIVLDWDLEPAWGKSIGAYHDPEFLLKHYVITRELLVDELPSTKYRDRYFETKACAPAMRTVIEIDDLQNPGKKKNDINLAVIRPPAQLVDDLADLPAIYRSAFLKTGDDPRASYDDVLAEAKTANVRLSYTMVPVDIAGSQGRPELYFVPLAASPARKMPLIKAELIFRHTGIENFSEKPGAPQLFLRIDDALARAVNREGEDPQRLPGNDSKYLLRFRKELAVTGGIYGVDALSQARERPSSADFAADLAGDIDLEVTLKNREKVLEDDKLGISRPFHFSERFQPLVIASKPPNATPIRGTAYFHADDKQLAELQNALKGSSEDLRAFRVAVRRTKFSLNKFNEKEEGPRECPLQPGPIESDWLPVDMALMIFRDDTIASGADPVLVETVIETYEHPRKALFDALDFDDADGEAGRLAILHPAPDATLGKFTFHRLADRGRTATRLSWNARPSVERISAQKDAFADPRTYAKLIGGFDLFEADLAEVNKEDDFARHARRISRVQRLPDDQRGLDPSEIADFEKVEALYPSETLRRHYSLEHGREDERAPWLSTAETLLIWPQSGLRRFLTPAPIEAELTPLFDRGFPQTISVTFGYDEATTKHWAFVPESKDVIDPAIKFFAAGRVQIIIPGADLRPPGLAGWTPSVLTDFLRSLIWTAETTANVGEKFRIPKNREYFRAVPVVITAVRKNFKETVTITVDLIGDLHPFLADVIDIMRWRDESKPSYRRYEPVLDGAPPTRAKTFEQFTGERPPQRDPYGWALLRTLGLATGLRLFDMETSAYLAAPEVIERIKAAMNRASFAYSKQYYMPPLDLAQPFADILLRHDGLHTLHSFDAAIDADLNDAEGRDKIEKEGLALVQIALRPAPELLRDPKTACVGYARIDCLNPGKTAITIHPREVTDALYEVINVAGGLAGGAPLSLALGGPENAIAQALVAEGTPVAGRLEFNIEGLPPGPVALVRITAAGSLTLKRAFDDLAVMGGVAQQIDGPAALTDLDGPEAFERFPPLSGAAIDLLCHGAKDFPPHPTGALSLPRLRALAEPRFALAEQPANTDWINDKDARAARKNWQAALVDLMVFLGRFTVHTVGKQAPIPYSLGAVVRQDPLHVAPRADGVMDVLLVHQDAWARRRRYVIRPFGRYENLWNAKLAAEGKKESVPTLEEIAAISYVGATSDESFARRGVDITLPRSHPLLPPAILSARRLDPQYNGDKNLRVPGRAMEFVLSRHPEEILSEANRQIADGYQFDHVGVAFYREFSAPRWARGLDLISGSRTDLIPILGDTAGKRPELPALSFRDATFNETHRLDGVDDLPLAEIDLLPERLTDGWRGITAVRTGGIPHFYRLHAVAHAAAGVVVSEPAAAAIPEGRPAPRLPWMLPNAKKDNFPPKLWTAGPPLWSVENNEKTREITVKVVIPLLRNYDSVPQDEYKLWLKDWPGSDPEREKVFRLPDAAASYTLAIVASAGSAASVSRSAEAELLPLPPEPPVAKGFPPFAPIPKATIPESTYNLLMAGPRFVHRYGSTHFAGEESTNPPRLKPALNTHWQVTLPLKRRPTPAPAAAPEAIVFDLSEAANPFLDDLTVAARTWNNWVEFAPRREARITLRRPPGTLHPDGHHAPEVDWTAFNEAMKIMVAYYRPFRPEGEAIAAKLALFATDVDGIEGDQRWRNLTHGLGRDFLLMLPVRAGYGRMPAGVAPYFTLAQRAGRWIMAPLPADRGIHKRHGLSEALRGAAVGLPSGTNVKELVLDPLRNQMARRYLARSVAADASSWDGYAPISRAISDQADDPLQIKPYDFGTFAAPLEFTRNILIAAPYGKKWEDDPDQLTALVALIGVLEAKDLPGSGRALAALEAVSAAASLDPNLHPSVEFAMPQTVSNDPDISMKLGELATKLTGKPTLNWALPSALTLRYPPSDEALKKLPYDDAFVSAAKAKPAIEELAKEQVLGAGSSFQVMLHRTGAFPLTDFIKRGIDA
ncbi:MAG: hypothetical protein ACKVP5_17755 [Aestuariivirga sp.]